MRGRHDPDSARAKPVHLRDMLEFAPDTAFDSSIPLESVRDVAYGPLSTRAHLLDILRPRATTSRPRAAVIHLHGGGWTQYGKYLEDCAFLAEAGFCAVSINYRYAQDTVFPAQLEDATLALGWVRGHANDLNIDPTRVYAWGISAGGHLAALLGVKSDLHLRGIGAICAPSDLTDQAAWHAEYADPNGGFQTLLGARGDAQPALAARASPTLQVSSRAAPFVIVHGELDAHVPVSQATGLHATLRVHGVPVTLHLIPDGDHFINESDRHTMQTKLLEFFMALEQKDASPQEATI